MIVFVDVLEGTVGGHPARPTGGVGHLGRLVAALVLSVALVLSPGLLHDGPGTPHQYDRLADTDMG